MFLFTRRYQISHVVISLVAALKLAYINTSYSVLYMGILNIATFVLW